VVKLTVHGGIGHSGYLRSCIGRFPVVGFSPNCCRGPNFFCSSGRFGPNRRLQFEPFSNPQSDLAYFTAAGVRTETDHPKTPIMGSYQFTLLLNSKFW
jgi:hypothetical protein